MTTLADRLTDHELQRVIGRALQIGVLLSAAVVLIGATMLLARHGAEPADYRAFHPERYPLHSLAEIFRGVMAFDARAIVQLGLMLLIATPVVRVALMLVAFLVQRDRLYVLVTALVLALLLYSLLVGR
jgi:uncharacterized membrane protein